MRASRLLMPTLREAPADAEIAGHRLLLRAGFIRKLAAGVYSYLPLGWRVHEKLVGIVRAEMNAIGGQEVHLPALIPKELMEESNRTGLDALFALRDRNRREFFLGFTHEEPITDIVRGEVRSWKQLPLILYQIQTKFKDEPRPHGGLLRLREFTMKDSYSFDFDEEGMERSYRAHYQAYGNIFRRCGLAALLVEAGPSAIGGSVNHEFMLLADSGEDTVLRCGACGYAANAECAAIGSSSDWIPNSPTTQRPNDPITQSPNFVPTPGAHTVAQVCAFLNVGPERIIKTILVTAAGETLAALVRGDRELNLSKLARFLGVGAVALADAATVEDVTGAPIGFAGPVGLKGVGIVADNELRGAENMVVGANSDDAHRVDVTPDVDFTVSDWADIRTAGAGDRCPQAGCAGHYQEASGIEVGHIIKLGATYSRAMGAQAQGEDGALCDILMGCYGLGITRVMAAVVEAHHDSEGIRWPIAIAPFESVIIPINPKDEGQRKAAEAVYNGLLTRGVDALIDDREERSGVKFKDADLIGCPIRVVAGRSVAEGMVEIGLRRDRAAAQKAPVAEAVDYTVRLIEQERQRYGI